MESRWLELPPRQLLEEAEQIAAAQLVVKYLPLLAPPCIVCRLLQMEDPLVLVRDAWLRENGNQLLHDEDILHVLWALDREAGS